jgi:hypothetical protein
MSEIMPALNAGQAPTNDRQQPSPGQRTMTQTHRQKVALQVATLLEHGYVPEREDDVAEEMARDWIDALIEFPIEVIRAAKRQWIRYHDYQPRIAKFWPLCSEEHQRQIRRNTPQVEKARPVPTTWESLRREMLFQRLKPNSGKGVDEHRSDIAGELSALRERMPDITVAEAYVALVNNANPVLQNA